MGSLSEKTSSGRSQPPEEWGKNIPGRGQSKSPNGENGLEYSKRRKKSSRVEVYETRKMIKMRVEVQA